jgi:hypothetical protein
MKRWIGVGLGVLCAASVASADELRHEDFRHGQRAMGMGGAAEALPGEPEATWYNPAALALVGENQLSGALHFFGTERLRLRGGLRAEGLPDADLSAEQTLALPTSSILIKPIDGAHTLAFSTFLVSREDTLLSGSSQRTLTEGGLTRARSASRAQQSSDQIVWMGPSWAWRVGPRLALGASAFYARRDQSLTLTNAWVEDRSQDGRFVRTAFNDNSAQLSAQDGALVGRAGALWAPHPQWTVGLSLTTASLPLHGQGRLRYTLRDSGDPEQAANAQRNPNNPDPFLLQVSREDLEAQTAWPWGLGLGVAWRPSPGWLLSASTRAWAPRRYARVALDPEAAAATATILSPEIDRQALLNGALGAEWLPSPQLPVRLGLFTNRSAAPAVPAASTALSPPRPLRPTFPGRPPPPLS